MANPLQLALASAKLNAAPQPSVSSEKLGSMQTTSSHQSLDSSQQSGEATGAQDSIPTVTVSEPMASAASTHSVHHSGPMETMEKAMSSVSVHSQQPNLSANTQTMNQHPSQASLQSNMQGAQNDMRMQGNMQPAVSQNMPMQQNQTFGNAQVNVAPSQSAAPPASSFNFMPNQQANLQPMQGQYNNNAMNQYQMGQNQFQQNYSSPMNQNVNPYSVTNNQAGLSNSQNQYSANQPYGGLYNPASIKPTQPTQQPYVPSFSQPMSIPYQPAATAQYSKPIPPTYSSQPTTVQPPTFNSSQFSSSISPSRPAFQSATAPSSSFRTPGSPHVTFPDTVAQNATSPPPWRQSLSRTPHSVRSARLRSTLINDENKPLRPYTPGFSSSIHPYKPSTEPEEPVVPSGQGLPEKLSTQLSSLISLLSQAQTKDQEKPQNTVPVSLGQTMQSTAAAKQNLLSTVSGALDGDLNRAKMDLSSEVERKSQAQGDVRRLEKEIRDVQRNSQLETERLEKETKREERLREEAISAAHSLQSQVAEAQERLTHEKNSTEAALRAIEQARQEAESLREEALRYRESVSSGTNDQAEMRERNNQLKTQIARSRTAYEEELSSVHRKLKEEVLARSAAEDTKLALERELNVTRKRFEDELLMGEQKLQRERERKNMLEIQTKDLQAQMDSKQREVKRNLTDTQQKIEAEIRAIQMLEEVRRLVEDEADDSRQRLMFELQQAQAALHAEMEAKTLVEADTSRLQAELMAVSSRLTEELETTTRQLRSEKAAKVALVERHTALKEELQQVKQSFETRQESLASQRAEERKAVEIMEEEVKQLEADIENLVAAADKELASLDEKITASKSGRVEMEKSRDHFIHTLHDSRRKLEDELLEHQTLLRQQAVRSGEAAVMKDLRLGSLPKPSIKPQMPTIPITPLQPPVTPFGQSQNQSTLNSTMRASFLSRKSEGPPVKEAHSMQVFSQQRPPVFRR